MKKRNVRHPRKEETTSIYHCKQCSMITEKKECLLCGSRTVKMEKPKKGPKGKMIIRFPRTLTKQELQEKETIKILEEKCTEFDCPGKVVAVKAGPVVTQFDFSLGRFIRYKRLRSMNEDLALALQTDNVAITRIPGQASVAIMVPNKERRIIKFNDTLENVISARAKVDIPLNLGINSLGAPLIEDLVKMPHLLVAGSTGSGKSVFLNCLITSMLYTRSPKDLELVLIDPKSVELLQYEGLPHLRRPPVSNVYDALRLLEEMIQEMRKRLAHIHFQKCKNLKEYNDKVPSDRRFPYVVVVIDEMADIILQEKKSFTEKLAQISSVARASGIHVICATQRPSVDVVTGKIKVNFPARISFRVPSQGDSKTVLTVKGAEQLMERGDAYFMCPGRAGLTRIHIPMVEAEDVTKMIKLSEAIGHFHRVPADANEKELLEVYAMKMEEREKQDSTCIADVMTDKSGSVQ